MNRNLIRVDAKAAPVKVQLEEHREAVQILREKGSSWSEIAEFLTERGVPTNHTRVYQHLGTRQSRRHTTSHTIDVRRITYIGEKLTKKKKTWNVMELEIPCKLETFIRLLGYVWGTGAAKYASGADKTIDCRDATLVTRAQQRLSHGLYQG